MPHANERWFNIHILRVEEILLFELDAGWTAPVARWAIWDTAARAPAAPSPADLAFVDPLLRRRLSLQAKIALVVANECTHDMPHARVVYASRHGELSRTTDMLENLAHGEAVSPAAFSMSVLNANVGLLSILQRNTAPSTAISATACSFGYGLLEAAMQLAEHPDQPVLLLYADEPIPAIYAEDVANSSAAHALGILLQTGAATHLSCKVSAAQKLPDAELQSRAFMRCLETGSASWQGDTSTWTWTVHHP